MCRLECRLRKAIKLSGCAPWDYPVPGDSQEVPICQNVAGEAKSNLAVFEEVMGDFRHSEENCDCPSNCEEVKFSVQVGNQRLSKGWIFKVLKSFFFNQVYERELRVDELCEGDWTDFERVMADWERTESPLANWNKVDLEPLTNPFL